MTNINRAQLLASLEARVPYDVSKPLFELQKVSRGRGWSGTVDKLSDKKELPDTKTGAILEALRAHELCGEKLCRYFRCDAATMTAIRSAVKNLSVATGPMKDAYPYLLDGNSLGKIALGQPTLIAVESSHGGTALVFGSVRALKERMEVDPKSIPDGAAKIFANFDEIIGLKLVRHQAVDVVWVPDNGDVIDLRIDFPRGSSVDTGAGAQITLMKAFVKAIKTDPFGSPINLFPLLKKMYDAPNEGRVVELAFGTQTRSTKHERMRVSADSLRTELYHVGGKANLNAPVSPYRLSISYTVSLGGDIEAEPELNLYSTNHIAENPNPQLFDALIRKTVGFEDYEFVRERILHFA